MLSTPNGICLWATRKASRVIGLSTVTANGLGWRFLTEHEEDRQVFLLMQGSSSLSERRLLCPPRGLYANTHCIDAPGFVLAHVVLVSHSLPNSQKAFPVSIPTRLSSVETRPSNTD